MNTPEVAALFAVSDARMPSQLPFPNSSLCLLARLAVPYATQEAISGPVPGSAPISVPMKEDEMKTPQCFFILLKLCFIA